MAKNEQAHVNTINVFEAPRVIVVRDPDGCLSFRIGQITINVYGASPYRVAPELLEMTEQEFADHKTAQYMAKALDATTSVE